MYCRGGLTPTQSRWKTHAKSRSPGPARRMTWPELLHFFSPRTQPTSLVRTSWSTAALCALCSKRELLVLPINEAPMRVVNRGVTVCLFLSLVLLRDFLTWLD